MASNNNNNKILFNYKSKEYSHLSNFYVSEMNIDGKNYYHVEGYFQSIKYIDIDEKTAMHIRNIFPPHIAKNRGNSKEFIMTSDQLTKWNNLNKIITMKRGLLTKFITNGDLAKLLIKTGDAKLVNNSTDDDYWGIGSNGRGSNMLGNMLMEVRDILNDLPDVDYED